ncbi:potassium-transporting ATPase subunit B [Klebsiella pneumoniae]|nr:potassium-transporting ATPase subunit B [Klebsiella pneumoniae]
MVQWRNPVMFIVWVGQSVNHPAGDRHGCGALTGSATFTAAVSIWLWFTVLFANFAEAMAEAAAKPRPTA